MQVQRFDALLWVRLETKELGERRERSEIEGSQQTC